MNYIKEDPREEPSDGLLQIHLTNEQEAELETDSLGEKLQLVINKLPPEGVTVAEIRDLVGKDSLLLLTIFLTLIFMVPVSIPGVSTVFGTVILLIAISRLFNRNLWLPNSFEKRIVSTDSLRAALIRALIWFHRLERVSRPHRLKKLTMGRWTEILSSGVMIVAAVLLMVPFGFIPFSNTLPAVALLFLAIGLLQRDGACILLGYLFNAVTIIYFAGLVTGGSMAVHEGVQYILTLLP